MKWPRHISLYVTHNQHKSYYETIQEYLKRDYICIQHMQIEDIKNIIENDSIWEVQWYPHTPIGSYHVAAATLERCMEIINSQKWT